MYKFLFLWHQILLEEDLLQVNHRLETIDRNMIVHSNNDTPQTVMQPHCWSYRDCNCNIWVCPHLTGRFSILHHHHHHFPYPSYPPIQYSQISGLHLQKINMHMWLLLVFFSFSVLLHHYYYCRYLDYKATHSSPIWWPWWRARFV